MTVAPTASWNPAVTQLVTIAYQQIGAIAEDELPTAEMYASAIFQLNGIVKSAEATGLHVWTEEEAVLFLQLGQPKYIIGGPTLALNANTSDADAWEELTLTASAAGGASSILVNSTALVQGGYNIGVILNSGVTFWTTIQSIPVAGTINLTAPLPASGASQGAFALVYTTPILRPLKVPTARLLQLNGMIETPMTVLSRQGYMDLPNKLSPGTPTQWFYSPRRDQGFLYVWPVPVTTSWAVRITWYRPIADLLLPGNTIDFPQEWVNPLMWRLAEEMMGTFDTPIAKQQYITRMSQNYTDLVISYDRESEPIQFGIDWATGGGT
jgi:hypothetical protein